MIITDVRDIIADDEALQVGIKGTLQEYNLEQFITADVPGCEHLVCCKLDFHYQDIMADYRDLYWDTLGYYQ